MRVRAVIAVAMLCAPAMGWAQTPAQAAMQALRDSVEKVAPAVGDMAPNFTARAVDASQSPKTVKLSELRGQVVVLAFYPGDRTTGCTAEMTKFRDEYDTLFGKGVVVLPLSVDPIDSHASWAKEMNLPFALVVDSAQTISRLFGSSLPGRAVDSRTVWVIGKDGKISFRNMRFGALSADAYTELASEVSKARG